MNPLLRGWRIHRVFCDVCDEELQALGNGFGEAVHGQERRVLKVLPRDLRGVKLAARLRRYGYQITRQTGSHVRRTSSFKGGRPGSPRLRCNFRLLPTGQVQFRHASKFGAGSQDQGFSDRGPLSCSKPSYRRLIIEWKVDLQVFTKGCIIPTSLFDLKPTRSGSEGLRFRRATRAVTTASRVPFSLGGDGERG